MTIKIEGFSEVLSILKNLFSGVKSAVNLPEKKRAEMKEAIANTAELIDETLTILKQHLTKILSEIKFGDRQEAKKMIYELNDFHAWENKYRQFQLCEPMREAAFNLERKGLYQLLNNASVKDPGFIQQRMWDYIGGESNAANSVGTMLKELSQLAGVVDNTPDIVAHHFEKAREEVGLYRQSFIDLEKEIRNSVT
jgi:hypothetical protein